jgi:hypothetical protein
MTGKIKIYAITVALFFLLIIIMTYPLFFRITTHIPAFFSTDESYAILWNSWSIKFKLLQHLPIKNACFTTYPFCTPLYKEFIVYLFFTVQFLLSILTSPILTYNLQVLGNHFLNLLFMYLLVYKLTGNRLASLVSGFIFAFSPYILVRSWQHLGETYQWPMLLFLWSLFHLRTEYRLRYRLIFILSIVLLTINFNVAYYSSIILALFLVYISIIDWRKNKEYFKQVILLSFLSFIILLPQMMPIFKNILFPVESIPSAQNLFWRPFEDLFVQSAKPLSYFLPAAVHPIFGEFTEQFIGTPLYGISFTEHTLYLGWTSLILSLIAFRNWRRRRKNYKSEIRNPKSETNSKSQIPNSKLITDYRKQDFYISFFIFLAIAAWLFSQPPWWKFGPIKIYMPAFFMYRVLPMFRAYCRFGIVVMLAVAVLAGFGLRFIIEKFSSQKTKVALTCFFSGLVLFEFWNYPPLKVIDVSKVPDVYYWLKEQPQDIVIAEYPLDITGPNELYKLYQTRHEKKIINGTIPGTYANEVAKTISRLSESPTTGLLKWMAVKYVLVHREDYLQTDLIEDREELDKIPKNIGLRFIKSFPSQECPRKDTMCIQKTGPIDVYEVVASPIKLELK